MFRQLVVAAEGATEPSPIQARYMRDFRDVCRAMHRNDCAAASASWRMGGMGRSSVQGASYFVRAEGVIRYAFSNTWAFESMKIDGVYQENGGALLCKVPDEVFHIFINHPDTREVVYLNLQARKWLDEYCAKHPKKVAR